MKLTKDKIILIIGLGLIGGSYAKKLSLEDYHVRAISRTKEDIDFAKRHGIIEEGSTLPTKEMFEGVDLVIFALYPLVFFEFIKNNYQFIDDKTIITDVTGIKKEVISKALPYIKHKENFIPSHPMAGREVYGLENAKENLFVGANFIITPTPFASNEAIELVEDLGKVLEFKRISILSPEEHDEMIAFLSQLTHVLAVTLMTCKDSIHLKEYTGDSFRDLTRIAKINENMWSELFILNKQSLLDEMNLFVKQFEKFKKALETEDVDTMKEMMKLSTYNRSFFDK